MPLLRTVGQRLSTRSSLVSPARAARPKTKPKPKRRTGDPGTRGFRVLGVEEARYELAQGRKAWVG